MTSRTRCLILLVVLLAAAACADGFPPEFPAADFTLKAPITGDEISYADLRGKPVIIYWFASW